MPAMVKPPKTGRYKAYMIDKQHKTPNIGKYNNLVTSCGFCDYDSLKIFGQDCIGFAESPFPQNPYPGKEYAVVYRCPQCHDVQWSHSGMNGYRTFLRYWHRHHNNAFAADAAGADAVETRR